MLLFILTHSLNFPTDSRFNTSHVTLYQISTEAKYRQHQSFNTSHVTLYLVIPFRDKYNLTFQYISCYSLSGDSPEIMIYALSFQYISCYSLSAIGSNKNIYHFAFQYISCYSLSLSRYKLFVSTDVSIHLMLLFIIPGLSIVF